MKDKELQRRLEELDDYIKGNWPDAGLGVARADVLGLFEGDPHHVKFQIATPVGGAENYLGTTGWLPNRIVQLVGPAHDLYIAVYDYDLTESSSENGNARSTLLRFASLFGDDVRTWAEESLSRVEKEDLMVEESRSGDRYFTLRKNSYSITIRGEARQSNESE